MSANSAYVGETVYFTSKSLNADSFYWEVTSENFVSNTYWDEETIALTFISAGTYTISLTATTKKEQNTMTKYFTVRERDDSGSSGSGTSVSGYKDFKCTNSHNHPYTISQTRDGVFIGNYTVNANSTKTIQMKCGTTEVIKMTQNSGYFEHPNTINMNAITVDCSDVAQGNYYTYTITCSSPRIVYKNDNSDPYYVEITCSDNNNFSHLVTLAGHSADSINVDAGYSYSVKFTQKSGYTFYPSTETYTVNADCRYVYTRYAPTNVKNGNNSLNTDMIMSDRDGFVPQEEFEMDCN